MKVKLIITLVFGFLLAIFALLNQHKVGIILAGFHLNDIKLSSLVFWAFVGGAVYSGILAILSGIRLRGIISRQKREIVELKDLNEQKF